MLAKQQESFHAAAYDGESNVSAQKSPSARLIDVFKDRAARVDSFG
jgi:hypothetical protein